MSSPFARPLRTFEAKYPGYCSECGGEFDAGDEVCYDSTDSLVHAVPEDCDPAPARSEKPCEKCFLVHAGDCF